VINVFAREITDDLASLAKKIDEQVGKHKDQQLSAFVVVLTDDPDAAETKLKELAEKHKIEHTPLTVFDGEAGPPSYKISKDADVTVLMWRKHDVKVNHAFEKDELDSKGVDKVVGDVSKILE
jgi:hypothetical protein